SVPENLGANNTLSSYRLDVSTNNSQSTDYMLNVMQTAPMAQASGPSVTPIQAVTGNMEGALAANWVVMFGKTELVAGAVTYTYTNPAQTQHLIVDLVPGVPYQVTAAPQGGQAINSVINSSAKGSLRLTVPAGTYTITLVPQGTIVTLASLQLPASVVGGNQ